MSTEPKGRVYFSREQYKWLQEQFPVRVLPVQATEAQMRDYFGEQRVIAAIGQVVR